MSIESHIEAISSKREKIKSLIADEMCHPMPDFMKITELKKQNMKLKEELMHYFTMQKHAVNG